MSFRVSIPRWLALAAAIALVLPGTGGCSNAKPPECVREPCFHIDDFICAGGAGGCHPEITRRANCCDPIWVDYRIEDITAKSGEDYEGVQSGRVFFPQGAQSATVTVKTLPRTETAPTRTFRLVLSVDGAVVGSGVGTIPGT
jgi:hypothetical protein